MPVQRNHHNTEHSYFFEVIDDLRRTVSQYGVSAQLQLGANVNTCARVGVEQTAGGVQNRGRGETLFAVTARRMIVLCTNRRLGEPRYLQYAGEHAFCGKIASGGLRALYMSLTSRTYHVNC